ncbi:chorismate mutase [Desulfonispora thiosulfatigenes DSM 11270]|uniref:UPF0735 ACT domain-containing protein SAMN00017405_0215 n=1 Tax=Desulfonispora thiosulfatigenes DSM 11270 TaxID=656914 RepID=A0A1W1VMM7_DESTI|nr:ACT domain-containing protein [Desulfonispora thiosulfatigenes]SMB94480.1 chorismate mutase [Desulfonispora thiosulfatigenes DSM 11270]
MDRGGANVYNRKKKFYIVSKEILPEAIIKTAKVKEVLAQKKAETVNEAVLMVGLSRSAFYKYRDGVFPFYEASKERIVTIMVIMNHTSGVLSTCLNVIAETKGSVLTINQGIPLQDVAYVSISIETAGMDINIEELIDALNNISGIKKVEIVGQS